MTRNIDRYLLFPGSRTIILLCQRTSVPVGRTNKFLRYVPRVHCVCAMVGTPGRVTRHGDVPCHATVDVDKRRYHVEQAAIVFFAHYIIPWIMQKKKYIYVFESIPRDS